LTNTREAFMGNIKGVTIFSLRKEVLKKGPDFYDQFASRLEPELRQVFQATLSNAWVPLQKYSALIQAAAWALYPDDPDGLRKIGRTVALDHMRGIYKFFLKVLSVPYLLGQVPRLWKTYHDCGVPYVDGNIQDRQVSLVVENFPVMPPAFPETNAGYIEASLELASARNVRVTFDASNPKAWRWNITWE
jgi:hypothetical protein